MVIKRVVKVRAYLFTIPSAHFQTRVGDFLLGEVYDHCYAPYFTSSICHLEKHLLVITCVQTSFRPMPALLCSNPWTLDGQTKMACCSSKPNHASSLIPLRASETHAPCACSDLLFLGQDDGPEALPGEAEPGRGGPRADGQNTDPDRAQGAHVRR